MKLLIVSSTPHYRDPDGRVRSWGPTAQEIDHLASRFDVVRHLAALHPGAPPSTALPYEADNIVFLPLPAAGGVGPRAKFGLFRKVPGYVRAILSELRIADAVHVRCPANIPFLATLLLAFLRRPGPRWVKYAGNWKPESRDYWSYRLQRWWLRRRLHRGVVTVNGSWPRQEQHVRTFRNPSFTAAELADAARGTKSLPPPFVVMYVGRLASVKGAGRVLDVSRLLRERGVDVELHLVGDGQERAELEQRARRESIDAKFHGWVPRPALGPFYSKAHVLLFPSASEGWPKVLSEGMAYGAVPIASSVSAIPRVLADAGGGTCADPLDVEGFANAVELYVRDPERWLVESRAGQVAAAQFTYERYLQDVDALFVDFWGIALTSRVEEHP